MILAVERLTDLASRALGGSVLYASDELFAERENLIRPEPPIFDASTFGHKGKVYDGWETRRRRDPGHDVAIVRLGAPGVIRAVVIDTAYFTGNFAPGASLEACALDGHPSVDDLLAADWQPVVPRSTLAGDTANRFEVTVPHRWTHVRLTIYPDGGVARLRVLGDVVPDPRFLAGTVDLAALENGGSVVECSDAFYGSPTNLIMPGRARNMGEGWENARRRGPGNDYVTLRLAAPGRISEVEIDTSYFVGNAPDEAAVTGKDARAGGVDAQAPWLPVLDRTRLQPDTRHRFRVDAGPLTHVRLDVYPDGGVARLRLLGEVEPSALAGLVEAAAAPDEGEPR